MAAAALLAVAAIGVAGGVAAITAEREEAPTPVAFDQIPIIPLLPKVMETEGYGAFTVNDGRVERTRRGDDVALYLHDVGEANGKITVEADDSAVGFGMVFRAQDHENYWIVRARPWLSGWTLEKVIDGESEIVGDFLKAQSNGPASIEILMSGRHIQLTIGDQTISWGDTYLADETHIGFLAENRGLEVLGWRDMRLWEVEPIDFFTGIS